MQHEWIYPEIGKLIRRRRKSLGKTQAELSPLLGISRASLANIETGRQKIMVHQIYALAEALNLSPEDLLPRSGSKPELEELPLPDDLNDLQKSQINQLLMGSTSKGTLNDD
ncbi:MULTISPECIES: helix-turn-helix domain-containing protein [unclassified Rhizobium]|uniref:helix-turn-helix domain-containing protein n=1 Tax=unclassified Rhizobium TaxID=2613769 RepID=UPI001C838D69|nr:MULTISPECIES: helix-turn-helix transcriptional regulator [unclassified Rhizobium]MBX5167028.1 helix-turn-helix transcriptional regulator [Rhizobium sp. NZLR4b]MBX5211175.1 helix-turn-helix transcriptional regulator [Rhizobium sp. NZLR11]